MKQFILLLLCLVTSIVGTFAQQNRILTEPMLGYNTHREVAIWVQAAEESKIEIKYWNSTDRSETKTTKAIQTSADKANTATFRLGYLEPGTTYTYQVLVDGTPARDGKEYMFTTQKLWQWRETPPTFSFIAGSCMYTNEKQYDRPGKPYGQGNTIFSAIANEDAEFFVWLGDNIYLREVDWDSRSGIYHRYTHMRQVPELQKLLPKMHHYAIWDDHDYGPNDSDWTYYNKDITKEAFKDFWPNLNYGVGHTDGITGSFWYNDCQFFLVDNRWDRTPASKDGKIIGDQQMEWLIDALRTSKANVKFVCIGGQFLSDFAKYENHAVYADERQQLLDAIDSYNIEHVVFLTGDRHHSEVSKYRTPKGTVIYDVTSSPLSSKSYDHSMEDNSFRVGETIGQSNYAVITIEGKYKQRKVSLQFKDVNGNVLATYPLEF